MSVYRLAEQPLSQRDRFTAKGAVGQQVRHPHVRQHRETGGAAAPALRGLAVHQPLELAQHGCRDLVLGVQLFQSRVGITTGELLVQRHHFGDRVLLLRAGGQLIAGPLGVVQLLPLPEHVRARQLVEQPLRPVHGRPAVQLRHLGGHRHRPDVLRLSEQLLGVRYGGRGVAGLEPLQLPLEERVQLEVQVPSLSCSKLLHLSGVIARQRREELVKCIGIASLELLAQGPRGVRSKRHDHPDVVVDPVVELLRVGLHRRVRHGQRGGRTLHVLRGEVTLQYVHSLILHRTQQVLAGADTQKQIVVHHDPGTLIQSVTVEVCVEGLQHVVADLQRLIHPLLGLRQTDLRQQAREAAGVVRRIAMHDQRQGPRRGCGLRRLRPLRAPTVDPLLDCTDPFLQGTHVGRVGLAGFGQQRGHPTLQPGPLHRGRVDLVAGLQQLVQRVHDERLHLRGDGLAVEQVTRRLVQPHNRRKRLRGGDDLLLLGRVLGTALLLLQTIERVRQEVRHRLDAADHHVVVDLVAGTGHQVVAVERVVERAPLNHLLLPHRVDHPVDVRTRGGRGELHLLRLGLRDLLQRLRRLLVQSRQRALLLRSHPVPGLAVEHLVVVAHPVEELRLGELPVAGRPPEHPSTGRHARAGREPVGRAGRRLLQVRRLIVADGLSNRLDELLGALTEAVHQSGLPRVRALAHPLSGRVQLLRRHRARPGTVGQLRRSAGPEVLHRLGRREHAQRRHLGPLDVTVGVLEELDPGELLDVLPLCFRLTRRSTLRSLAKLPGAQLARFTAGERLGHLAHRAASEHLHRVDPDVCHAAESRQRVEVPLLVGEHVVVGSGPLVERTAARHESAGLPGNRGAHLSLEAQPAQRTRELQRRITESRREVHASQPARPGRLATVVGVVERHLVVAEIAGRSIPRAVHEVAQRGHRLASELPPALQPCRAARQHVAALAGQVRLHVPAGRHVSQLIAVQPGRRATDRSPDAEADGSADRPEERADAGAEQAGTECTASSNLRRGVAPCFLRGGNLLVVLPARASRTNVTVDRVALGLDRLALQLLLRRHQQRLHHLIRSSLAVLVVDVPDALTTREHIAELVLVLPALVIPERDAVLLLGEIVLSSSSIHRLLVLRLEPLHERGVPAIRGLRPGLPLQVLAGDESPRVGSRGATRLRAGTSLGTEVARIGTGHDTCSHAGRK